MISLVISPILSSTYIRDDRSKPAGTVGKSNYKAICRMDSALSHDDTFAHCFLNIIADKMSLDEDELTIL